MPHLPKIPSFLITKRALETMFAFETAYPKVLLQHHYHYSSIHNSNLKLVRKLASASKDTQTVEKSQWKVAIVSENNFPTKAGLASSASGYACLGMLIMHTFIHSRIHYRNELFSLHTGQVVWTRHRKL